MKRSEINNIMLEADEFIQKFGFKLPPFAYWSASHFKKKKADASEIIRSRCGWDITDYGCGKFHEMGLFFVHSEKWKVRTFIPRERYVLCRKIISFEKGSNFSDAHTHRKG